MRSRRLFTPPNLPQYFTFVTCRCRVSSASQVAQISKLSTTSSTIWSIKHKKIIFLNTLQFPASAYHQVSHNLCISIHETYIQKEHQPSPYGGGNPSGSFLLANSVSLTNMFSFPLRIALPALAPCSRIE